MQDPVLALRAMVWDALSRLWLDTPTDGGDIAFIVGVLERSGYDDREIDRIMFHEVAPALQRNLLSPAGVWVGFDQVWLAAEIQRRQSSLLARWMTRLAQPWLRRLVVKDWARVLSALAASRSAGLGRTNPEGC